MTCLLSGTIETDFLIIYVTQTIVTFLGRKQISSCRFYGVCTYFFLQVCTTQYYTVPSHYSHFEWELCSITDIWNWAVFIIPCSVRMIWFSSQITTFCCYCNYEGGTPMKSLYNIGFCTLMLSSAPPIPDTWPDPRTFKNEFSTCEDYS